MSDQEAHLEIGQFVVEHGRNKTRLAAMETRRERIEKAVRGLADALAYNAAADFNLAVAKRHLATEPLSSLDIPQGLIAFLSEYAELRRTVEAGEERMRQLGLR